MSKKVKAWIALMELGARMGCHQIEERSFSIRGYQFPLCARCTGVLVGELSGVVLIVAGYRIKLLTICIMIALMGIDWGLQYFDILKSNNKRRVLTGGLCGIGATYLYFYFLRFLYFTIII